MPKIACRLICDSISAHIQQLYTGFSMLHRRGLIDITQDIHREKGIDRTRPEYLRGARRAHLRVILNERLKLHYDVQDRWEINDEYLREVDFYFKRSFSSPRLGNLGKDHRKIHPLGLNYQVYPSGPDRHALKRRMISADRREQVGALVRSLCLLDSFRFTPRVHLMESLPAYDAPAKILFVVRAWDPRSTPELPEDDVEERECINQTRANCIRLLRRAFGDDFCGGFIHTDFAVRNYGDLLLPDGRRSLKKNYMDLVRVHSIGVATTGLHGSIGGKFGEYVAFSKAIVSEKLNYEVPGGFEEGRNYLAFGSPEECVEKARQLRSDRELRHYLMTNNARYYQSHVRPDSLILNTLLTALSEDIR